MTRLTRLLAAGAALAALASLPASAQAPYTWTGKIDTGGLIGGANHNGAWGGIFNAEIKSGTKAVEGALVSKYSVCVDPTTFSDTVFTPEKYDTLGTMVATATGASAAQEKARAAAASLVQKYLRLSATQGNGTLAKPKGYQLQWAVWHVWSPQVHQYTGTDSVILGLIAEADYSKYTGGVLWLVDNDPIGNPSGLPRFQGQLTYVPEAGALQFAAFAGIGALALLRRRRA